MYLVGNPQGDNLGLVSFPVSGKKGQKKKRGGETQVGKRSSDYIRTLSGELVHICRDAD